MTTSINDKQWVRQIQDARPDLNVVGVQVVDGKNAIRVRDRDDNVVLLFDDLRGIPWRDLFEIARQLRQQLTAAGYFVPPYQTLAI